MIILVLLFHKLVVMNCLIASLSHLRVTLAQVKFPTRLGYFPLIFVSALLLQWQRQNPFGDLQLSLTTTRGPLHLPRQVDGLSILLNDILRDSRFAL